MKNKKLVLLSTILLTILLSSCGNKEVEKIEEVDNTQVLNDMNNEVANIDATETTSTWTDTSIPEAKVQKLNKTYVSPGWNDEVEFTVIMNGILIENVEAKLVTWNPDSEKYTAWFAKWINEVVKGKTTEEASTISIVSGASLTTEAFKSVIKDV